MNPPSENRTNTTLSEKEDEKCRKKGFYDCHKDALQKYKGSSVGTVTGVLSYRKALNMGALLLPMPPQHCTTKGPRSALHAQEHRQLSASLVNRRSPLSPYQEEGVGVWGGGGRYRLSVTPPPLILCVSVLRWRWWWWRGV